MAEEAADVQAEGGQLRRSGERRIRVGVEKEVSRWGVGVLVYVSHIEQAGYSHDILVPKWIYTAQEEYVNKLAK
jgi:hypothetical protein